MLLHSLQHPNVIAFKRVRPANILGSFGGLSLSCVFNAFSATLSQCWRTFAKRQSLCSQAYLTPEHLGIMMEYAAGGELYDQIAKKGKLSEVEARFYFQQLVSALSYLHDKVSIIRHNSDIYDRS